MARENAFWLESIDSETAREYASDIRDQQDKSLSNAFQ